MNLLGKKGIALNLDVFLTSFRSILFLQLAEEKSLVLKFSVAVSLESSRQGTKNHDMYRYFLVINYLILNEIISSTTVYNQDANRSRGLY